MRTAREGRVFLVGFMGAGKTTVGSHLARILGYRLVDLDRQIEKAVGMTVREIFEQEGEEGFRRREAEVLRQAASGRDVVIATGGGALLMHGNLEFIRKNGVSVWLDAPLEVMLDRCRRGAERPLFSTPERMAVLLSERMAAYADADIRIETQDMGAEEVARLIAARVKPCDT